PWSRKRPARLIPPEEWRIYSAGSDGRFCGVSRVLNADAASAVIDRRYRSNSMEQNPPPPTFPSPEELKTKITEFMKQNFGDRVSVAAFPAPDTTEAETDDKSEKIDSHEFDFNFLPRDIKAHLDRFVIKQDEAKKALSIAVCDHYN